MPLENFIQAVQTQLDKAQTAMTMKARNLNMPLTFAIKDISLDLRAHVDFSKSEIRIRPAGSSDAEASMFHLVFAAITRPMIEENSVAQAVEDPHDRNIDEIGGDSLTEENRRRLEWVGVRTVSQLRDIEAKGGGKNLQRVTGLPLDRLRAALAHASTPSIDHIAPVSSDDNNDPPLIRIRGHNLLGGGGQPRVTLAGQAMAIVSASDREMLLAPQAHQWQGEISISSPAGQTAATSFDLTPFSPSAKMEVKS